MKSENDAGLGLVEVVVAMFILAIIMMAMITVVISGLTATAEATTRATAMERVQERLEEARAAASEGSDRCTSLADSVNMTETVPDGRGIPITVTGTMDACDNSTSDAIVNVLMTASTTSVSMAGTLASTETDIYVKVEAAP